MIEDPPRFKKRKTVAVLLSLLEPGFGQIYAGHPARGAVAFGIYLAVVLIFFCGVVGRSFVGLVVSLSLIAVVYLGSAIDAGLRTRSVVSSNPFWRRGLVVLAVALLVPVGLRQVLPAVQRLKTFSIPSVSMEPTIQVGDHLVAALDAYRAAPPVRNDLAIFATPEDPRAEVLARVVALAGDRIEIRDKKLFVNGRPVEEPWAVHNDPDVGSAEGFASDLGTRDQMRPTLIPPGHFFALGDNRDSSYDCRFYGPVLFENLKGKALYLYWSRGAGRMGKDLG